MTKSTICTPLRRHWTILLLFFGKSEALVIGGRNQYLDKCGDVDMCSWVVGVCVGGLLRVETMVSGCHHL